jgi:hypothetical protein
MNATKMIESPEGISLRAQLGNPPLARFGCDCSVPFASTHWGGELSERARVVALLLCCEYCLLRREHPKRDP